MANNIEQFLIEFVFNDKGAVKKIEEISKQLDKVIKVSQVQTKEATKGAAKRSKDLDKETLAIKRSQNALQARINTAQKLGIETKFYERSLSSAKKKATIDKRSEELRTAILRRQNQLNSAVKASPEPTQRVRVNAELRREISLRNKINRLKYSSMGSYYTSKNEGASTLMFSQMEKALRRGGVAGAEQYEMLKGKLRDTVTQMRKTERAAISLRSTQEGLRDSTRNLVRSYASVFAVMAGINAVNKVGREFEGLTGAMTAATGSAQMAQVEIDYLEKLSVRLGLGIASTADQYAKFLFAASGKLPTEEVKKLFTNVAEAGTALGVSQERMKLSFIALQQMMNKNQVRSEELKNQLAESFPGAIQIFARALGKSEQEMLKMMDDGELLASDILPKVADEMKKIADSGGALETRLKGAAKAQDRFMTAMELTAKRIYQSGFDDGVAELFITMTNSINESGAAIDALGGLFKTVFKVLTVGFKTVYPILDSFVFVLGTTAKLLSEVFGTDGGKLALGIAAAAFAMKNLNTIANSFLFKLLAVIGVIDEIYALFVKGRVGVIELAMGEDVDLAWGENIPDFFSENLFAGLGAGLATLAAVNVALKIATLKLTQAVWANVAAQGGKSAPISSKISKAGLLGAGLVGAGVAGASWLYNIQQNANEEQNARRAEAGLSPLAGTRRQRRDTLQAEPNPPIQMFIDARDATDPKAVEEAAKRGAEAATEKLVDQSYNGAYQ